MLNVPSLHCAVAFCGALAGGVWILPSFEDVGGVGRAVAGGFAVADAGAAGAGLGAGVGAAAGALVMPAIQLATPPWPEHAPRSVLALV